MVGKGVTTKVEIPPAGGQNMGSFWCVNGGA